jgi:hypothetical protein
MRPESAPQAAIAISDAELARRALASDAAAFRSIMGRCNRRLYRIARGILGADSEAEDAAYLSAFTHLADFRGEASLGTWLTRIALNAALEHLRRKRAGMAIEALDASTGAACPRTNSSLPLKSIILPHPALSVWNRDQRGCIEDHFGRPFSSWAVRHGDIWALNMTGRPARNRQQLFHASLDLSTFYLGEVPAWRRRVLAPRLVLGQTASISGAQIENGAKNQHFRQSRKRQLGALSFRG